MTAFERRVCRLRAELSRRGFLSPQGGAFVLGSKYLVLGSQDWVPGTKYEVRGARYLGLSARGLDTAKPSAGG